MFAGTVMGLTREVDLRVSVISGEEISKCRRLGVVSGEDLLRQGRKGHFVDPGRAAGRDRLLEDRRSRIGRVVDPERAAAVTDVEGVIPPEVTVKTPSAGKSEAVLRRIRRADRGYATETTRANASLGPLVFPTANRAIKLQAGL
jgi:hypothetical protein